MIKNQLKFSICLPVYKGSHLLKDCLDSIFKQDFQNYEIIIGEDNPLNLIDEIKKTKEIIDSYQSDKIKYIKNRENLGYAGNLRNITAKAEGDVLFLLGQDDILSKDCLQRTHDAFFLDADIGCVTRPYFWFTNNINNPVRAVLPYDGKKDSVISIFDGEREVLKIFESVGQLSGLALKKEFLETPFNDECFVAHIYPFAGILKNHKCVYLKDYTIAVGIKDSQTRSVSSIYDLSPTLSWINMFRNVFSGDKYKMPREWGIKGIATHFVGLVQLKNYAKPGVLFREIKIMIKSRPRNLLNIKFWFYALGTMLIPRNILRKIVDYYKERINSKRIKKISFK